MNNTAGDPAVQLAGQSGVWGVTEQDFMIWC